MSDPNHPTGDHDPVDRAYAEAEAVLRDDADRAARRARVLGAVAAAQAAPEPQADLARASTPAPPRRPMARTPAPWLMAAGVAGVASLVGLRIAPTAVERPAKIESAPAPLTPKSSAVGEGIPSPPPAAPPTRAVEPVRSPPAPVQARSRAAAPVDALSPPPPSAPIQSRVEATPPPPLPIPPAPSRVETPAPPPPPLPIPPVARRLETPAATAAISRAYGEAPAPFRIANPEWVRRPSDEDIGQFYPERAARTETSGSATLSCTVTATGGLRECAVVSETPAGYGFGEAALRLSRLFRIRPTTADGAPTEGGTARAVIEFKLPD